MLGFISGEIIHQQKPMLVIKTGQVGYNVQFSAKNFDILNSKSSNLVEIAIHTQFTTDQIQLFGFLNFAEKQLFELLISVSGCGPKVAFNLMDRLNSVDLLTAVKQNNPTALQATPGLGRTTAAKLLAGLSSPQKLAKLRNIITKPQSSTTSVVQDVETALLNLGFNQPQIQAVLLQEPANQNFEVYLQNCLKRLDKKTS